MATYALGEYANGMGPCFAGTLPYQYVDLQRHLRRSYHREGSPRLNPKNKASTRKSSDGRIHAIRGTTLNVPTLTHGTISVPLTDIVKPTTVKRIPGQGLPYPSDPLVHGDLLLGFDIEYPRRMTDTLDKLV
ncbi:hypothetical protein MRX96_027479 [Rhipicephalus microplus]